MKIFNTLSGEKETFTPIDPEDIKMYVCGPTVYDFAHIGNARPAVVFDILFRTLSKQYKQVSYARNITDIDDKINNAAKEQGVDISVITKKTEQYYKEDMASLNVLEPTFQPRATETIPEMISIIKTLVEKQHAYEAEGHVLFDVKSFADYGALSKRSLDDMIAGARVEVAPYKKNPHDFVLWKPSDADQPGWESPWGFGRPGWHIECSAMIEKHLGTPIDIHGGGHDLTFPHHENEIAQGTCAHEGLYAKYWMHNGMIQVDGKKMSKSLGNFFTVRDLLGHYSGEVMRLTIFATHYRQPLNWTEDALEQSKNVLAKFNNALKKLDHIDAAPNAIIRDSFINALNDDLNTPAALTDMHACVSDINKAESDAEKAMLKAELLEMGSFLGILEQTEENNIALDANEIEALIQQRNDAKANKDYETADRIRDELKDKGVSLEDGPGGTTWRAL